MATESIKLELIVWISNVRKIRCVFFRRLRRRKNTPLFFLRPPEAASKRTSYFEHVTKPFEGQPDTEQTAQFNGSALAAAKTSKEIGLGKKHFSLRRT